MIDFRGSYCGPAPSAAGWISQWNDDPVLIAGLGIAALFAWRFSTDRRAAFAGLAVLAIAFLSPVCALSSALFAARSVHHLLLVGIAAPLLAIGFAKGRTIPLTAALLFATATLWGWHLPAAYDAALADKALYWVMEISLTATAWAYWRALLAAPPVPAAMAIGAGAAVMGFLGAILTFAPLPLYAVHQVAPVAFGITPLADQQLGGMIMWVPGMIPYGVAAGLLARRWSRMLASADWAWRTA